MDKEIIEAMKVLKENCKKNLHCYKCCFYNKEVGSISVCKFKQKTIEDLNIPEQQEEIDIQGIEEINEETYPDGSFHIYLKDAEKILAKKQNEIIRALKQLDKTTIKVKVEEK